MFNNAKIARIWNRVENIFFLGFAISILWITVNGFFDGTWKSISGMGFLQDITDPVNKKIYYKAALAIISILTTFFLLFEMVKLFLHFNPFKQFSAKRQDLRKELHLLGLFPKIRYLTKRAGNSMFMKELFRRYKTNFLAKVFNEYISKLFIIFVYIEMMPYFHKFALFTIPNTWYGWLYAYLMWELTYWIWHYLGHRVRLFWCLHSPHHAPAEMNLTVAWVHFFAEGYYTAIIQVPLLMLFGVTPEMVAIILVIDGTWGTFIHAGEDAFKNGRLGFLEKILITPSHHRVHHAKNPLYIDTNFCVLLPFWDWLFGTLQNEKQEVKIEYGITRETEVTNFIDMYFGECICLFKDLKATPGFVNKIKLLFFPPGWRPDSNVHTAKVVRQNFLKGKEYLARTSRDQIFGRSAINEPAAEIQNS
ncbi:sterol desaturase family protein [Flavihumibacter profundi]|uniref:sterol desaturase family protein n=1 Tax=Flavihumibacter profundi TaxID=2716883 RepID=UPI001CC591E6|nr:sterol desaturase family protein [Flavihumibacter profundi]MBZ5859305.1 sterol desaturase family protein [Flavihumibacter profundi]